MFKPTMPKTGTLVEFQFEDEMMTAIEGDNVAAALLRAGEIQFRTAKKHDMRGPYCMVGVCFECLVEVDGKPNQQACQTMIRDGMQIRRQQALNLDVDIKG
jgi:predicted molibdopterin-dependent oxidoreductase YjgC